jgi:hypothetical protein
MRLTTYLFAVLLATTIGCGDDSGGGNGDGGNGNGDGGGPVIDSGPTVDADDDCQAPDMLFVLDRTMSMHRRPDGTVPANNPTGHMETKWYIAVTSIKTVTAQLQATIRFGLSLFPLDPGNDMCVTLTERIGGQTANNQTCQIGETVVSPQLNSGMMIDSAVDVETTRLCTSTPIGGGLTDAITELASIQNPIRAQYAVLLTDGRDTCDENLALTNADTLAAANVGLYVIGFDGSGSGIDNGLLNDLACAGHTTAGFPAGCTDQGGGVYRATDRTGAPLYQLAEDAADLVMVIEEVAGQVCCNCIE